MTPVHSLRLLPAALLAAATTALWLSGCSSVRVPFINSDRPAGATATGSLPDLEVPPTLSQPDPAARLRLPQTSTALASQQGGAAARDAASRIVIDDVRIESSGEARWLVTQAAPEVVFAKSEQFLAQEGWRVARRDPGVGVLETDWSAGRTAGPRQGGLSGLLRGVSSTLFRPDFQDKLKLSVEPASEGGSRIYVSLQRVELTEEGSPLGNRDTGVYSYKPSAASADLERETSIRLLAFLTGNREAAERMVADSLEPRARIDYDRKGDRTTLNLRQDPPLAYNRLRYALDKLGYDVVTANAESGELRVVIKDPERLLAAEGTDVAPRAGVTAQAELELRLRSAEAGGSQLDARMVKISADVPKERAEAIPVRLLERLAQSLR